MKSINFKKYEENKGFEEYQAEIFNSIAKRFGGQTVTAQSIKSRLQNHRPPQDRKGITIAFDGDKPIAYIQYREYDKGKVRIGYPWALEGTPQEVQDKLFYDLLDYLKEKYPDKKEFYHGNLNSIYTEVHEKLLYHYGFTIHSWFAFYSLDFKFISDIPIPDNYSFKEVSKSDLPDIVNVCLLDPNLSNLGIDGLEKHFNDTVFNEESSKTSTTVILMKNEFPVAVAAVIKTIEEGKENSFIRIVGIKEGEENSYQILLSALGKILGSKNYTFPLLIFVNNSVQYREDFIKSKGGVYLSKAREYKLTISSEK